jgi:uncharacterized repeat protein (TIGR02543 family)/uncharacterized repeat protein (TIGR01451 family)
MPCLDSYTWRIIDDDPLYPDPIADGTVTIEDNRFIIFKPGAACRNTAVTIRYAVKCSSVEDTATLVINVTAYNRPVNVLPPDVACWNPFPSNVGFDVQTKFHSNASVPSHANDIIVYSVPLVGDLNGDGKPEILAIGLNKNVTFLQVTASARYITILDGQNGKKLVEHPVGFNFVVSSESPDESHYHSSPSYMAIADVDNDGHGEIIMAFPVRGPSSAGDNNLHYIGKTVAFDIVTNNQNIITGLAEKWVTTESYKLPLTNTTHREYDVPAPYIADLNGDGIPEVIVYNKIYNAQTGRLLMAWNGPAATAQHSSLASNTGLRIYENADVYTSASTSDNVYNRAFVGRRPSTSTSNWKDDYIAVFAVENMDADDDLEVIAGNRIHKFRFNYLGRDGETGSHTDNTYTTVEGPRSVTLPTTSGNHVTYYLSDAFTRVADIDGDGRTDVINVSEIAAPGTYGSRAAGLITLWDPADPTEMKAAAAFWGNGGVVEHIPSFGIPFVGDINGKTDGGWNGTQFTRKLPEIGILTSDLYINASNTVPRRNGITFHPLTDTNLRRGVGWNNDEASNANAQNRNFNRSIPNGQGHIFAVTYCDSMGIVPFHRRLKLSWAMEHDDRSSNTGLTIFDFNNDGAKDLVYRDERTLRVISPRKAGEDYVALGTGQSVMFSTTANSFTGFEAPIVADVNMDASADIVVTNAPYGGTSVAGGRIDGWISVFEYKSNTTKWAPAPPVWNQAYYNPRHIREDLTVPARPAPIQTAYTKDGETIWPYNSAWEQQTYVRDGQPYTPVVRYPDAEAYRMNVTVNGAGTTVELTIRNRGSASIAAGTPLTFYDGNTDPGYPIGNPLTTLISGSFTVGVDIFPGESVSRTFTLPFNGSNRLIWARIGDDGTTFPADGFVDCDPDNNTISGADCPDMKDKYHITYAADEPAVCAAGGALTLTAVPKTGATGATATFRWYCNDSAIPGATAQTYNAAAPGSYTCFVTEGICRQYTPPLLVGIRSAKAQADTVVAISGLTACVRVLDNDTIPSVCNPVVTLLTQPAHGTAQVAGDTILYTSTDPGGYTGTDEFVYSPAAGVNATVHVRVVERPGNIGDDDCHISPPAGGVTIREIPVNLNDTVDNCGPLTVGDIDGDGRVEVLAYRPHFPSADPGDAPLHRRTGLLMFGYKNDRMQLKRSLTFRKADGTPFSSSAVGAPAIARYHSGAVDDDGGYIVVLSSDDGHLYAFDASGAFRWRSGGPATEATKRATVIGITDFNGDGMPEVYTGNRVFSLLNGNVLCDGGSGRNKGELPRDEGYSTVAVDMDGDGLPELCAGTQVCKVRIPAGATAANCGVMSLWAEMPAGDLPADAVRDGATQAADVDNDGRLEVIVISRSVGGRVVAYAWKPLPGGGPSCLVGAYAVPGAGDCYGLPVIGNVDDSPYPEIIFLTDAAPNGMCALEYRPGNAGGSQLALKWEAAAPAGTGMSLFDFNLDGIGEIVCCDDTEVRLIDGRAAAPVTLNSFREVTSWTLRRAPVVADVDGDGQAELILTGGRSAAAAGSQEAATRERYNGYLRVFKGDGVPWPAARRVWNQYAYQAVHIGDDLTVPRYQISPATLFPGTDGQFGSGDERRPYNAFLQQPSGIDRYGSPLWPAPDGRVVDNTVTTRYDADGDSLVITLKITNAGAAGFQAPLYLTAYRDDPADPANKIASDSLMSLLNVGDTVTFTRPVYRFSRYLPVNDIVVRLNDRGNGYVQAECAYDQHNQLSPPSLLLAGNDYVSVNGDGSGRPVGIAVLENDRIPCAAAARHVEIVEGPGHGTATLTADGDSLLYTPAAGDQGRFGQPDTMRYRVVCDGDTATALVSVAIHRQMPEVEPCAVDSPPPAAFPTPVQLAVSDRGVYEAAIPFVGDVDRDGRPEVVVPGAATTGGGGSAAAAGIEMTDTVYVFDHRLQHRLSIALGADSMLLSGGAATFLIADVNRDGYGELVYCTKARTLRCYTFNPAAGNDGWLWTSDEACDGDRADVPVPVVADADGDGTAEILAGNRLFAGESGKTLLTLPDGGARGYSVRENPQDAGACMPVFADVDNDGRQELVAGYAVYGIRLANRSGTDGNAISCPARNDLPADGFTAVADVDLDGDPDVIVAGGGGGAHTAVLYVWDGRTDARIAATQWMTATDGRVARPAAGDIDGDGYPEIIVACAGPSQTGTIAAYKYQPASRSLVRIWDRSTDSGSALTPVTLFDFDRDGRAEIVCRDATALRILDGRGNERASIPCPSAMFAGYPVIADADRDGQADVLVSGTPAGYADVRIVRYGGGGGAWAAARPVWHQHGYSPLSVNDDLSLPRHPVSPSTVFPGADGQLNTWADNVRPYNHFLQQQTAPLRSNGTAYRPSPDVVPLADRTTVSVSGDAGCVTVAIRNRGEALIAPPVHVTLYDSLVDPSHRLGTGIRNDTLFPGDTACVTVDFLALNRPSTPLLFVVRVNDDAGVFPHREEECDTTNNTLTVRDPSYSRYMKKRATLNRVPENGTYGNPVAVLYGDTIHYEISAYNLTPSEGAAAGTVIIRDTLPANLTYVAGSANPSGNGVFRTGKTAGTPPRDTLTWTLNNIPSMTATSVRYRATPEAGAAASQTLFINRAWITTGDTIVTPTDSSTYHQGAGISIVTFSASAGGIVYNASPQALDYRTSALAGVLALPEEGYTFTGWSHDAYSSLRGEAIEARSGIMCYDTLIIYGDVELVARFEPIAYPIRYALNGGTPLPPGNPSTYTKTSAPITLTPPDKPGDIFTGWTGSNGIHPQTTVSIPSGSTGERFYYANYLHSGREEAHHPSPEPAHLWGADKALYLRTTRPGITLRIYTSEGLLHLTRTISRPGLSRIPLPRGLYIVTLNSGGAQKVYIE